jgi:hypothetical protein
LLTKRTHIVPILIALLVFPAAAIAATGGGDSGSRPLRGATNGGDGAIGADLAGIGVEEARVVPVLRRPPDHFRRIVSRFARRIDAERRAEARKRRRELYANLPGGVTIETLEAIASCESGGDPTVVSADGSYRGKYQFSFSTWESVGGSGDPAAASEAEQDYRAALLYASAGSSPWPVCG